MTFPAHWRPRSAAVAGGPAVVFDLDGVISDATHRQWYLRQTPQDWRGFFEAGVDDDVIESGRALAGSVDGDHAVVILTARPGYMADGTVAWLDRHQVRYDVLIIRPPGDRRPSADYKRDEVDAMRALGFDVRLALDDDAQIIDMYRDHDVEALYVHSGYYERRDAVQSPTDVSR